jgi:hypothetical protein
MARCLMLIAAAVLFDGALLVLTATAAAPTAIGAIVDSPASYADQDVTVVGTVSEQSFGYRGESAYTLKGDDRRLSVISSASPPVPGTLLQVTGKIGFRAPDEEFTWPPVLLESGRSTP